MRTTPNDVNEKRNDDRRGGRERGSEQRQRDLADAPQRPGAEHRRRLDARGSRFAQTPPTMRTTTATLKNAWATRIAQSPRSMPSGRSARNAGATTTVGSTNGTTTSAPTRARPRNRKRPTT